MLFLPAETILHLAIVVFPFPLKAIKNENPHIPEQCLLNMHLSVDKIKAFSEG